MIFLDCKQSDKIPYPNLRLRRKKKEVEKMSFAFKIAYGIKNNKPLPNPLLKERE